MRVLKIFGKFLLCISICVIASFIICPTNEATNTLIISDKYIAISYIVSIGLAVIDWKKLKNNLSLLLDKLSISWCGNYAEYYADIGLDGCNAENADTPFPRKENRSNVVNSPTNNDIDISELNKNGQLNNFTRKKEESVEIATKFPTPHGKTILCVKPSPSSFEKPVNCEAIIREEENWRRAQMGLNPIEYELRKIDAMEGHIFERWCANVLEDVGFCNVRITQKSRDQGVDILAEKDDIKYAIQCKCYAHPVGNDAVQAIHSGKSIYGCHVGIVMTNRSFTPAAKEAADATGVLLWDREKIIELLKMQV